MVLRSLTSKVVAVVAGATVVTAIFFTVSNYLQVRDREYSPLLDRLHLAADVSAENIRNSFNLLVVDANTLADIPPVKRILLEATEILADGMPINQESLPRAPQLAEYMRAAISRRPTYTQMRILSREGNWKEILRIDQTADGVEMVEFERLQTKGHRDYIQPLIENPNHKPYFSAISENIDHGVSDGTITTRYVRPIRDGEGVLLGAVIINADYEALIRHSLPEAAEKYDLFVVTDSLDVMHLNVGMQNQEMVLHTDPAWTPPPQADLVETGIEWGLSGIRDGMVFAIVPTVIEGRGVPFGVNVLAQIPEAALLSEANAVLWDNLKNGIVMTVLAAMMAWAMARRLMAPLLGLTESIRTRRDWTQPITVKTNGQDEVSVLAQNFSVMSNELVRISARARSVVDAAADGIVTINTEGLIEEVNPAFVEIFGYAREELVGHPLAMLMPHEIGVLHQGFVDKSEIDTAGSMMAPDRDIYGIRKDGTHVPLGISVSAARYADRTHFIGVVRDVTEERAAERQREALIAALRRSNEELDQFAYVASHDLKAPLRVIDNASRWLEEDLEQYLDDDTRESMELMRSRVRRMERLLDDLLSHSRIGRIALPEDFVSGDELVQGVIELLPQRDGIEVSFDPAFSKITVDRLPLQTVLVNLVSNAIRHHDKPAGEVRVGVTEQGDGLEFTVADDGPGIDPRYHDKIFGMFQTLKSRDEMDTSGMGLAMVRKHLDLVGGEITVISDGQSGTTFRLAWPTNLPNEGKQAAA
ncbi:sensor histidine kinase [Mesobacterium pallidum]|uniref:sensor histidine kinase n=1 Tax=Mesobacterium pallidum TaxID=2872037 RepID=UPI001EE1DC46|nr:ATP-binding protein [Mesobacterium pallidum]